MLPEMPLVVVVAVLAWLWQGGAVEVCVVGAAVVAVVAGEDVS